MQTSPRRRPSSRLPNAWSPYRSGVPPRDRSKLKSAMRQHRPDTIDDLAARAETLGCFALSSGGELRSRQDFMCPYIRSSSSAKRARARAPPHRRLFLRRRRRRGGHFPESGNPACRDGRSIPATAYRQASVLRGRHAEWPWRVRCSLVGGSAGTAGRCIRRRGRGRLSAQIYRPGRRARRRAAD